MNIGCRHAAHDQITTPDPAMTAPKLPSTEPDSLPLRSLTFPAFPLTRPSQMVGCRGPCRRTAARSHEQAQGQQPGSGGDPTRSRAE
jgi:hypothetical protein